MSLTTHDHPPATTSTAAGRAGAPNAGGRRRRSDSGWWPLLFAGPFFAGIVVFYLFPIVQTAYFSLTDWGPFGGTTFVGADNWRSLLDDDEFLRALLNTVVYVLVVLLGVPIAVGLAALLNRPTLRGTMVYRTMFFLPYLAMPVAIALVWRLMFNGDYGVINAFLGLFGIDGPYWLSTQGFALVAVAIVGLWMSVGFNIIILSAGLRSIPPELYEAASLDGAGRWAQFVRITVPLLTPSIFFVLVMNVIGGFQLFDLIYAILGNSPVIADTKSLVYLFYDESFVQNNRGYGAVIAFVILLIIAIVTAIQFRLQRRWVHYA
ncbi:carbohydrate ABC transporter permease [Jiangella sp. DSM 45060]|uniref:carbohydrate ABC transporter permease n=1 Tax=Jiangella sp. DSM 45060 TaxID=1798224 RepID=UPI00087D0EEA|nr:sugar ABC transporter permease [Jiangella sp. DSM 45060]SDS54061.1 carbohydrate ABC transporter membrane protein 1, CUT1 family [Jiangella sp. DSM 45060]